MTDKPIIDSAGSALPRILTLRGQKVILDADLAAVYGVPTKRLNEQVKRNTARFPSDFMFRLDPQDVADVRSQFATASVDTPARSRSQFATLKRGENSRPTLRASRSGSM